MSKTPSKKTVGTGEVKLPPHSIHAEQAVLGGLLLDKVNHAWDKIADKITAIDFYQDNHRIIFETMTELVNSGQNIDSTILIAALKRHQKLDEAGGEMYIHELRNNTPSVANVPHYADIVRERSILRQLISISNEIADTAFNPEKRKVADILDEAERKIFQIAEQNIRGTDAQVIGSLMANVVDRVDEMRKNDSLISGLSTGFTDLDKQTCGLQPGELIIIAGRPSMGKTAFALNIAEHVSLKVKKPVLMFSMEMSAESLAARLLSSLGNIDSRKLRTGQLDDKDWLCINNAVSLSADIPLFIDDTAALSPSELRARARRFCKQHGEPGCIIVDYLQLMNVPDNKENRVLEISTISRSLKALAKEIHVPVLALSQLNRGLEQRTDKRPIMSDLRESGALEQDADLIVFIYRDEVYNEDSPYKGSAEIIIGKQRNGPIGTTRLTFIGNTTRFRNAAANQYEEK